MVMISVAGAGQGTPGKWNVQSDTSPLTDLPTISAQLDSEKPLLNMLGQPEPATIVLRCQDRVLAAYVSWPQVIERFSESLGGQPEAIVFWKLDQGQIEKSLWTISTTGTAAGAFSGAAAAKLIASWRNAHRLAVRLTGQTTQDALFDLTGIDIVAEQVLTPCGGSANISVAATPEAAPSFSTGTTVDLAGDGAAALARARSLLEGQGFTIDHVDEASGTLVTQPLETSVTPKQANCGSMLGIPYLADRRAHPTVAYRVVAADHRLTVSAAIEGIDKPGHGVADELLKCTSKGMLEAALSEQIISTVR